MPARSPLVLTLASLFVLPAAISHSQEITPSLAIAGIDLSGEAPTTVEPPFVLQTIDDFVTLGAIQASDKNASALSALLAIPESALASLLPISSDDIIKGDMNLSGFVDFDDVPDFLLAIRDPILYFLTHFGETAQSRGDFSNNGIVDFDDLRPFREQLPIPELGAAWLMVVGAVGTSTVHRKLRRRRPRDASNPGC